MFKYDLYVYRVQYLEKSKNLQDQLRDLKTEIEVLKVDEKQCELDMLHDEQVRLGENKYSTLKKVNNLNCNVFLSKLYYFGFKHITFLKNIIKMCIKINTLNLSQ